AAGALFSRDRPGGEGTRREKAERKIVYPIRARWRAGHPGGTRIVLRCLAAANSSGGEPNPETGRGNSSVANGFRPARRGARNAGGRTFARAPPAARSIRGKVSCDERQREVVA